ncbi:type II toxin-antitoxin system VapC family toxin [Granulicella mallensis]|uniref:PilT protein domain protein n=1 Tax=Granulicella mallensis (strain ATCC BAA-1857 / DSM 23137 / MP5ACTX8) TaxID=682795 RepID=G8P0K6_GRAMM|nr:type II toxin-antitoxin system VapC family toxin [Granulicella mallensis]AEU34614.1 PilT protein domain protein [Granulicella mallensis MP5ACTX8]
MKVLVDTHVILWAAFSSHMIGEDAAKVIGNEANTIFVSAASAWEIATKVRIGKLPQAEALEKDFSAAMSGAGYTLLPITIDDALRAGRLLGNHRDPFDRMIVAQALAMDIPVISIDSKLDTFGVRRIW